MSLSLNDKKEVVAELSEKIVAAQTIVIAEYRGMSVSQLTQLRVKAREQKVYLRVLKNTLARRAMEEGRFSSLISEMSGPLIYSISEDPVAAAKVISDFAKSNEKLIIKAGSYLGKKLDGKSVSALANIPSREILLSQLLGVMQAPVASFARGLAALSAQKEKEVNVV